MTEKGCDKHTYTFVFIFTGNVCPVILREGLFVNVAVNQVKGFYTNAIVEKVRVGRITRLAHGSREPEQCQHP